MVLDMEDSGVEAGKEVKYLKNVKGWK